MLAYQRFVELSGSAHSDERGQAAHFAASAFAAHQGPMQEHAALYAALVCFLDDASVKVRAALAYGLLHTKNAPRPIMISLLSDAPIIARAVAQYSPVLVDADLLHVIKEGEPGMLEVISCRPALSLRVAKALLAADLDEITLHLLERDDLALEAQTLIEIAERKGDIAKLRGALLARSDLPPIARLRLVEKVQSALLGTRMVAGAVAERRLQALLQNNMDAALTEMGESQDSAGQMAFCAALQDEGRLSTRVLLHALLSGRVAFFSASLAQLASMPPAKVATLLGTGSRAALNALFARCGMGEALRNLVARLIFHARNANLADDLSARHFVVTALIEELICEHDGHIPSELEEAFAYLNGQNVTLARQAARGVMPAFADAADPRLCLPGLQQALTALPAA